MDGILLPVYACGTEPMYDCRMDRTFLLIGAILGFLGVSFGAFAAHALRSRISPEMLAVFETGVRYQMYHAFAVLIVAAAIGHIGNARLLSIAGWFFFAGIVCFPEVSMLWP
jgi:uncharacterized membrane protein YgdD (TMEM256/DUF423 family)